MMSIDEKVACSINVVFGAALGFAIYLFALDGLGFLLTDGGGEWWKGWMALLACVGGGGVVGFFSYTGGHEDVGVRLPQAGIYRGFGGQWLLVRRLGVIAGAIVAFYFIWQLAKGI